MEILDVEMSSITIHHPIINAAKEANASVIVQAGDEASQSIKVACNAIRITKKKHNLI